jgi:hypothetical protein
MIKIKIQSLIERVGPAECGARRPQHRVTPMAAKQSSFHHVMIVSAPYLSVCICGVLR